MINLNLVNQDKSNIKYKISKFPDGQQQVAINPDDVDNYLNDKWIKHVVQIKSRLNNFQDLELIICTTKSLRNLGVKEIHLYTPYFLGSRSDRQFEEGSNNYLKDVICPIINNLNFESVTVRDPHSDVLEACLNNFKKLDNLALVVYSLNSIYINQLRALGSTYRNNVDFIHDKFILVSPDAGASKKIYKLVEQIDYKGDIITCSKDRDIDGKLTKTIVPLHGKELNKDVIIIDDICDGGATFINISKQLKQYVKGKIYLIVTHGIFSKGFNELSQYFDGIYCTNSYGDALAQRDGDLMYQNLVKQLNVF